MADDVGGDQLVIIRIEGMHCHKCERRDPEIAHAATGRA